VGLQRERRFDRRFVALQAQFRLRWPVAVAKNEGGGPAAKAVGGGSMTRGALRRLAGAAEKLGMSRD
jgi:hypothetical protein